MFSLSLFCKICSVPAVTPPNWYRDAAARWAPGEKLDEISGRWGPYYSWWETTRLSIGGSPWYSKIDTFTTSQRAIGVVAKHGDRTLFVAISAFSLVSNSLVAACPAFLTAGPSHDLSPRALRFDVSSFLNGYYEKFREDILFYEWMRPDGRSGIVRKGPQALPFPSPDQRAKQDPMIRSIGLSYNNVLYTIKTTSEIEIGTVTEPLKVIVGGLDGLFGLIAPYFSEKA